MWGPDDACLVVPGRRRDLDGSSGSSDESDVLQCWVRVDDGCWIVLPSGWLVVEANGRPPVSMGSDMTDGRGDGRYISKLETGPVGSEAQVEIGQGELDVPDLVVQQTTMS